MPRKKGTTKGTTRTPKTWDHLPPIPATETVQEMEREGAGEVQEKSAIPGPDDHFFAKYGNLEQQGMRIKLSRRDDFTKKWTFHGYLTQREATTAQVQEWFGGGQYIVQLMAPKQEGGEGIRDSDTFRLSGVYNPPVIGVPGVTPRPPGGVPLATGAAPEVHRLDANGRIPEGVSAKDYMDNALLGKLLDVLESKSAKPVEMNWAAIITAVGTVLSPVMTALIERKPDNTMQHQFALLMGELEKLKAQPGPTTSAITDISKAMRELMSLRQTMSGEDAEKPEPEPMVSMLSKGLDLLTQMRGPSPAPVAATPTTDANVPQIAPGVPVVPWFRVLKDYEGRIVDAAMRGLDPVFVAEMTVTYLPDVQRGAVMELLARPDTVASITQVLPALAQYPKWLGDMVTEMRSQMLPEPDGEGGEDDGRPGAE